LVEQSADAIFIVDAQANFLMVNAQTCAMSGYAREEPLIIIVAAEEDSEDHNILEAWMNMDEQHLYDQKRARKRLFLQGKPTEGED
jgi:PAS domain S-box-containing protein